MWTLRTAVILSVGLLDPSVSVYRDGCLSFSVSVQLGSLVVLCRFSWWTWLDCVDQLCGHVLELQCLTVTFCSAHGGQHADTQFCSCGEFSFQFCMAFRPPRNVKPVKLKLQFFSLFVEVFVTCNATVCFGFLCK